MKKGITFQGPVSVEVDMEKIPNGDVWNWFNGVLQEALEKVSGVEKVINTNMNVFEDWDPEE